MAAMGGFSPLGGGTVNFGGSLTKAEQATAATQMTEFETKAKAATMAGTGLTNSMFMFGPAGLAAAAGVGIAIDLGKKLIDTYDSQEQASRSLTQAYTAMGLSVPNAQIQAFIDQNSRYIPSISAVEQGFATLTRSGLNQTEVQLDMNRAVDLAALKHIDLSQAVQLLDAAEHGRMRGLIDLGVTTAKFTDAQGNLIPSMHSVEQAMKELDPRLKDGRKSLSDLEQSQNDLNISWDKFANQTGPGVEKAFSKMLDGANAFIKSISDPKTQSDTAQMLNFWKNKFDDIGASIDRATDSLRTFFGQTNDSQVASGGNLRLRQRTNSPATIGPVYLTSN